MMGYLIIIPAAIALVVIIYCTWYGAEKCDE
jgi:hypothetical protein